MVTYIISFKDVDNRTRTLKTSLSEMLRWIRGDGVNYKIILIEKEHSNVSCMRLVA